jgi:hypothetical protein
LIAAAKYRARIGVIKMEDPSQTRIPFGGRLIRATPGAAKLRGDGAGINDAARSAAM